MAVTVDQDFGIGIAAKEMAGVFELCAELAEVVDRAVEYDADFAAGRKHRLAASLAKIENRKAPVAQNRRAPVLNPFAVGTAARKGADHRPNLTRGAAWLGMVNDSSDTAH
jgi:hypothetical protein